MKDTINRKKLFIAYSLIFAVMCPIVYYQFFAGGRSFIWYWDGWNQHFKALIYYSRWLKDAAHTILIEHSLNIPTYSFSFGYGADIYSTLHYYVIGDPLNLLSVFFSADRMVYLYNFLILLRLYLAGFCFINFVLYTMGGDYNQPATNTVEHTKNLLARIKPNLWTAHTGILAGTFTYVFCGYALYAAIRHPYFSNPMIYLPLILLGVEKVLREKKPLTLILSVFLSAVSNFYFFYAIVLLTVLYVLFRLSVLYAPLRTSEGIGKMLKNMFFAIMKIAGFALIGVAMSAVILLPVILLFMGDARSGSGYIYSGLYRRAYYEKFPATFLAGTQAGDWTILAYSALTLPAVLLLFLQKKKYTALKIGFLMLTLFLLLPVAGHIFNGFSYVSNRWNWGYGMLNAYILVLMWPKLFALTKKEFCLLAAATSIYTILALLLLNRSGYSETSHVYFQFILAGTAVLCFGAALLYRRKTALLTPVLSVLCLLLTFGSIWKHSYFFFVTEEYVEDFIEIASIPDRLEKNEGATIKKLDDNTFWRYTSPKITRNITILNGLSNTQYNWSLANGNIPQFFKSLHLAECMSYIWSGLDNRTIPNTLLGVKYYVAETAKPQKAFVPFGYLAVNADGSPAKTSASGENVKSKSKYTIYKNQYALPLGYTYEGYLLSENYNALSAAGRQEAMIQALIVDEPVDGFSPVTPTLTASNPAYKIRFSSDHITKQGNSFVVTKNGASIRLTFTGGKNSETSLLLTGLSYEGRPKYTLYNDDPEIDPNHLFTKADWDALSPETKKARKRTAAYYLEPDQLKFSVELELSDGTIIEKELPYNTPRYIWYNDVQDYLLNLGYHEQEAVSLRIRFPYIGTYRFEELGIVCQPMEQYADSALSRGKEVLENLDLHNDNASFSTSLITGTINLSSPKLLCLSIPYSDGFTAYVDGKETKLIKANLMMMALPLSAGEHEIKLIYRTPGLTAGFLISVFGCIILCAVLYRKRKDS